ncbi:MAG: hypothetical protein ACI4MQ_01700 [Candidatus Coproplasma sp.]
MPFIKLSKSEKKKMLSTAGYRERDIVDNAKCVVNVGNGGRYIKVVSKPDRYGDTKTAIYDTKTRSWRG